MYPEETIPLIKTPTSSPFIEEPNWAELLDEAQESLLDETLILDRRKTLKAKHLSTLREDQAHALPTYHTSRQPKLGDFQLIDKLGEGGMGEVHLARQNSMWREVAIKQLHGQHAAHPSHRQKLIEEACITGRLEHPNIVPVYSLGVDEHDTPMFVMKRIEGVSWYDTIQHPEHLPRAHKQHSSTLECHFEIFEQVCMAMHYAHAQGIVHRDLKPDNIMLGEYGEVYVVDWGLAVSTRVEDRHQPIPQARAVHQVEGTPMYMAPEQAAAEGHLIGPHTDIYALGVILHELITGTPRHQGATLQAMLLDAYQAKPVQYPATIHPALGAVCNKACSRDPAKRHTSPEALREHLNDYRKHRRFDELLHATKIRIEALEQLAEYAHHGTLSSAQMVEAHGLSGATRFAIERAREIHPEHDMLEAMRSRMLHAMMHLELDHKNLAAAQVFHDELGEHISERGAAHFENVSRSIQAEQEHIESLKHMETELSFGVSRKRKAILGVVLCVLWGVGTLALKPLTQSFAPENGYLNALFYKLIIAVLQIVIWFIARQKITLTRANTSLLNMLLVVIMTGVAARVLGWQLEMRIEHAVMMEMLCFAVLTWCLGAVMDRFIALMSIIHLSGIMLCLFVLPLTYVTTCFALCNLMAMLITSWHWYRGKGTMAKGGSRLRNSSPRSDDERHRLDE